MIIELESRLMLHQILDFITKLQPCKPIFSRSLQIIKKYDTDNLAIPNKFTTFASLEPAKPLYNAQIGGSFFLLYIHENEFHQTIFFSETNSSNTKIKGDAYKR